MPTETTWRDYLQAAAWGAAFPAVCYLTLLLRDVIA